MGASTSSWASPATATHKTKNAGAYRATPPLNTTTFDNLPTYHPPNKWTKTDIITWLPGGTCGAAGTTREWFSRLNDDSLDNLCLLLDLADDGYPPHFWTEARVTLIPKAPDAPAGDLRPITILPLLFRLWFWKHANHIGKWMLTWIDAGLLGGVPGRASTSATNFAAQAFDRARFRQGGDLYYMTLDQSKCFDMLSLDNLDDIASKLNIKSLQTTLGIYRRLSRLLFLDGTPTNTYSGGTTLTHPQAASMVYHTDAHSQLLCVTYVPQHGKLQSSRPVRPPHPSPF